MQQFAIWWILLVLSFLNRKPATGIETAIPVKETCFLSWRESQKMK